MFFRFRRRLSAVRLMTCALSIFRKIYFINEAPEEDARITRQEKTRLCILCKNTQIFHSARLGFHYFLHRYALNCAMTGKTIDCIVTRSDLGGNLHTPFDIICRLIFVFSTVHLSCVGSIRLKSRWLTHVSMTRCQLF